MERSPLSPLSRRAALLRAVLALLLICLLTAPALPARAQGETGLVTATIILTYGGNEMPCPLLLQFDAAGGQAYAQHECEWDTSNDGSADFYFLLFFLGTFSGFPEGRLEGTVQGSFLVPTVVGFLMAFDDSSPLDQYFQEITGTFEGTIAADGSGGGTWSIFAAASPNGNVNAWDSPTDDTWRLEALDMSAVTVVPPTVLPPSEEVPAEVPVEPGVETESEAPAESSDLPAGQVGTMAGAALAGTALGLGLSQLIPTRRIVPKAPPMATSPATGRMVPAAQARQEQARMASGWVYREGQGWEAPHGDTFDSNKQSILGRDADAAREEVRSNFARYTAERRAALHQEQVAEYREMAERHIQGNQEALDRALTGITVAEVGIETTYDVAAAVLIRRFPVKTLGRAANFVRLTGKKILPELLSEGYSQVKILTNYVVNKFSGEETSFWQDQAMNLLTKPLNKIPGGRFANPARALGEEAAKSGAGNALVNQVENSLFTGQ